jgi:trehalose-6-phosphatase
VILLDYDGTLVGHQKLPQMAVPPPSTLALIHKLADDERNNIYIISGRDRKVGQICQGFFRSQWNLYTPMTFLTI